MMSSSAEDTTGEASARPRAIVTGHGTFPEGMVTAVQQIAGRGDMLLGLSNAGLAGEDIEARLRARAGEHGIKVFFTDLPAGSATIAVRRMMRTDQGIVLVTGANLATLLAFVFHTEGDPGAAALDAADKGRAALVTYGAS